MLDIVYWILDIGHLVFEILEAVIKREEVN